MIALGTPVAFSSVAYVVRKARRESRWCTPPRGNFDVVSNVSWDDEGRGEGLLGTEQGRLLGKGENKNVIALPCLGSGVVIGLERKFAGKSVAGTYGGEDFESGWFEPNGQGIDLYVVKSELRGKAFYVPQDAIAVITS